MGICFALQFSENVSILESQKIYIKLKQNYSLEIHANGEEDMLKYTSNPDSSIINFDATKGNTPKSPWLRYSEIYLIFRIFFKLLVCQLQSKNGSQKL